MEKLIIRALGLLLRRLAARQPLVVYLDDLHWADTSSVELLAALLGLAARYPILFLLAYRPGVADSVVSTLAEAMGEAGITGEEIRLAPLDRGAGERMLENLFIGGSLPHGMRALIEERASGNPFFIEQVVLSLIDSGHVEVRDGNLRAADRPEALVIPATVEELLMARIDQLPLAARQVLHIASIVDAAPTSGSSRPLPRTRSSRASSRPFVPRSSSLAGSAPRRSSGSSGTR
jgi:predicted ATPase